jgi:hypothetical protein
LDLLVALDQGLANPRHGPRWSHGCLRGTEPLGSACTEKVQLEERRDLPATVLKLFASILEMQSLFPKESLRPSLAVLMFEYFSLLLWNFQTLHSRYVIVPRSDREFWDAQSLMGDKSAPAHP